LLFQCLIFSNKIANAEWSMYGETEAGYHFIDLNNTSSDDRYVYYWILTDYKEPQKIMLLMIASYQKKYTNKLIAVDSELVRLKSLFTVRKCLKEKLL